MMTLMNIYYIRTLVSAITDQTYLCEDINAIITWSKSSQLNFNVSKFTHISFKSKFVSSYNLSYTAFNTELTLRKTLV